MKKELFILSILLLTSKLFAQFDGVKLEPGDTFSFIQAYITNPDNSPYVGELVLQGEKPYHRIKTKTDKEGFAKVKVPFSDTYTLYCGRQDPAFRKVIVGDFPYVTHEVRTYTHRFIYFKMSYMNEQNQPLKGEQVEVRSVKTNTVFIDSTNANGRVNFFLPYEDSFFVSVKYYENLSTLTPKDVGKEYKVIELPFVWMGSKEKERRAWVADSIAQENKRKMIVKMDSIIKFGNIDDFLNDDFVIQFDHLKAEFAMELLQKKAELFKAQLKINPKFFESRKLPVLAVLYRLKNVFPQQYIVSDVTCSMDPYMEQVMIWHALNFAAGKSTNYLFFNDGNGIDNSKKLIGKTGGFHLITGSIKDFKQIVESLIKSKSFGCSGDTEENDVEALLHAAAKMSKTESLVLIADNFSPMRDFSLIKNLKVPVRVILCGIENNSLWSDINEEYLALAYKTGGSVHTLTEDIYDLYKLAEGKKVKIGGIEYMLENGNFRKIIKS
jgi:hypothetical protein